jgi:hypothetical protein
MFLDGERERSDELQGSMPHTRGPAQNSDHNGKDPVIPCIDCKVMREMERLRDLQYASSMAADYGPSNLAYNHLMST